MSGIFGLWVGILSYILGSMRYCATEPKYIPTEANGGTLHQTVEYGTIRPQEWHKKCGGNNFF